MPQYLEKNGMKSAKMNRIVPPLAELHKTLLHLCCRCLGKGDDKNRFRSDMVMFYQIFDPLRGHKGFAGAGTRQYQHCPVSVLYRFKLCFICILFKHFPVTQYPF